MYLPPFMTGSTATRCLTWLLGCLILLLTIGSTPAGAQTTLPAWGVLPTPNAGAAPNELQDIAVLSPTDMWAVGSFGDFLYPDAAIHHWDGVMWQLVDLPPGVGTAELYGVAAIAADDVWFVGGRNQGGQALILHWNGHSVNLVTHPNPGTFNRLYSVAAVAPDDIWAVGEFASGGVSQSLTLHWDGATWSLVPSPTRPNAYTQLNDVAALAADDVWAVGQADDTFTLHWDGATWQHVPSPNAGDNSSFNSVSAISSNEVWAVGDGSSGLLSARWNGSQWQRVRVPNPPGLLADLHAVKALASKDVWAVGYYSDGPKWNTLALHWNGTRWRVVSSPSPDPSLNIFYGIDGHSSDNMWAVGQGGPAVSGQATLTAQWDGATWQIVPSANGGVGSNSLHAISAVSPDDMWAVGDVDGNSLTLYWDGATWSVVPSPNLEHGATLNDVVAMAADDVWAVGSSGSPADLDSVNVMLHWDGAAWALVPTPNPGGPYVDELFAIDGIAADDIWAVGEYWDANLIPRGVILHWDGVAWSEVTNGCGTSLTGVSAVAADDVWAVGDATTCHFDGVAWSVIPSPQPQGQEIGLPLQDVAAVASDDIWAVGASVTDFVYYLVWEGLAEHWNGSQWVRFDLPGQVLYGIEALASDDVWAVGSSGYGPIILHYDGQTWQEAPTPLTNGGQLNGIASTVDGKLWSAGAVFAEDNSYRTLIMDAPSATQGGVMGEVGVSGAVIAWFGPVTGSTEANSFGEYAAAGLPAGEYFFVVSAPGCTPASTNFLVVAGVISQLDMFLSC